MNNCRCEPPYCEKCQEMNDKYPTSFAMDRGWTSTGLYPHKYGANSIKCNFDSVAQRDEHINAKECGLTSNSMCNCPNFNGTYGTPHTLSQCGQFGFKEFTLQEHFELKNFMDKIIEVAKRDSDKRTSSIVFLKLLEEIGEYTAAKVGDKKADEKPHEELVDTIIAAICLYSLEGGSIEHLIEYGRYKLRKYDKKMGY